MFVPLSFGEDGTSFEVPDNLEEGGWLVTRKSVEGRGRPSVVHRPNGRPLVIPFRSTHEDLLNAAGKGRFRLHIVDRDGRKVEGLPAAHTGMLGVTAYPVDGEEYEVGTDDGEDGLLGASPVAAPRRSSSNEIVLLHTMCSMFGQAMGSMVPMMNACTEIVETVSRVGLLGRMPAQDTPPPVAPAPPPVSEGASTLQTVMATLMPMVNQLCMALMMKGAAPTAPVPAPVASMPAPVAPMPPPVTSMPPRPAPRASTPAPMSPAPTPPSVAPAASVARQPMATPVQSPAGAAPSDPAGAAPAEISPEMQMRIGMQLRQVLAELTPDEQHIAGQLVMGLPPEARTALLLELVHLSIPEAVARAREILASAPLATAPSTPPTSTAS